jgi:hypothetical protein
MVAASTPLAPKVWKLMGNLGSRLFFLNMNTRAKTEEELVLQLTTTEYKQREKACRDITGKFLQTLWYRHSEGVVWDRAKDDVEVVKIIVRCAQLLAKLRGVINIWKDGTSPDGQVEYSFTAPLIEKPDRINQLFYNLARGHAVIMGRQNLTREDLKVVIEVALDSAPTTRTILFDKLLKYGGEMSTADVEHELNCSKPTARKEMESLKILGIVDEQNITSGEVGNQEKSIVLKSEFYWFLSEECRQIRSLVSV